MSSLFAVTDAVAPGIAVEMASTRVSAAALEWRSGRPVVAAHAVEPLSPGALTPSLTAVNAPDRAAVMTALNRALERVGRPRRIGLIVPDVAAKVSLVRFETVPARASDLDQLIRWQVRKTAPFPIEDAQMSYVPGLRTPEGQEFIVTLARRSVIEEYEGLCAEAGAHAGLIDLSTFSVINAVLAGPLVPAGDWLAINVAGDSASIAIMRDTDLIFFRNRSAETDGGRDPGVSVGPVADLMHQTAMYYEDRLKGAGLTRVILAGGSQAGADIEQVRRGLEQRVGTALEMVDPRQAAALTDRIAAAPALLDTLAPLVGLLLRDSQTEGARG
jgi:Tfp pilus assembly PilM family ATPase